MTILPRPVVRRSLAALALALALCACQMTLPGSGPSSLAVLGGEVVVAAAPGYCISPETVRQSGETAVVLIGRCRDGTAADAALVTVSIADHGSAAVLGVGGQGLADFFASAPGRATLARSGRAEDVTVERAAMQGADFLMLLHEAGSGSYWRAITGLRGRLVTVSVAGTREVPLTEERAREVLLGTLAALHRANS